MQYSTTALAFVANVVSIARISNDWDSINLAFSKPTRQHHASPIPYGLEEFGLATWTNDYMLTGPNVGIQVGQFLSVYFKEWQKEKKTKVEQQAATVS